MKGGTLRAVPAKQAVAYLAKHWNLTEEMAQQRWPGGMASCKTQFEEPFENVRRSNQLSRRKDNEIDGGATRNEIWLPESNTDSNTVLENRKCARFSAPLTKGKSSEMDFRRRWFSYQ